MELERLEEKYELLRNEHQACRRKLDSKCEALLILSREMDQCRSERDQFKLMAEQLQERYQTLKRQLAGKDLGGSFGSGGGHHEEGHGQNIRKLLCDSRDQSKSLQFEVEDMKQKLADAQGDIKLLREQIARQRVGTTDEGINTRHFPAYEREDLVQQLEAQKEKYLQLERDLQQVLDEKEEQETERDAYKTKYERLNTELNFILKGDENRILDIDALVMENKFLQDRLKQMEEEKTLAMATASKYKSILEKKKNKGSLKLGQNRNDSLVISQKQVTQLLEDKKYKVPSAQAMADLRGLASALLETINDKNLALSHQRKTNKILGNRVAELEKKLRTLEVSGLWNCGTGPHPVLAKIRTEYEEVKSLLPDVSSPRSEQGSDSTTCDKDASGDTGTLSTPASTLENSPAHIDKESLDPYKNVSLTDLDLLPTKEVLNLQPLGDGDQLNTKLLESKLFGRQEIILEEDTDNGKDNSCDDVLQEGEIASSAEENVTDPTELKLWQLFEAATVKVTQKQSVRSPVHQKNANSKPASPSHKLYLKENLTSTDISSDSCLHNDHKGVSSIQPDLLETHKTNEGQDKHIFASGDPAGLFQDSNTVNVQV